MPRFLDVHSMKGLDEDSLKEIQNAPTDEFGVLHLNILYNPEVDRCFCLIEAPSVEADSRRRIPSRVRNTKSDHRHRKLNALNRK